MGPAIGHGREFFEWDGEDFTLNVDAPGDYVVPFSFEVCHFYRNNRFLPDLNQNEAISKALMIETAVLQSYLYYLTEHKSNYSPF